MVNSEDVALEGWLYGQCTFRHQALGGNYRPKQEEMDDVEVQGGRNFPFQLATLVRQFWSGIHDLPYAFCRELITQITEIPE